VGVYLDQGLKALVFSVQFFVEVDRFDVAAAELPINLLHAFGIAARKLRTKTTQNIKLISYITMLYYTTNNQLCISQNCSRS